LGSRQGTTWRSAAQPHHGPECPSGRHCPIQSAEVMTGGGCRGPGNGAVLRVGPCSAAADGGLGLGPSGCRGGGWLGELANVPGGGGCYRPSFRYRAPARRSRLAPGAVHVAAPPSTGRPPPLPCLPTLGRPQGFSGLDAGSRRRAALGGDLGAGCRERERTNGARSDLGPEPPGWGQGEDPVRCPHRRLQRAPRQVRSAPPQPEPAAGVHADHARHLIARAGAARPRASLAHSW